jgi:hypothetical protein
MHDAGGIGFVEIDSALETELAGHGRWLFVIRRL